MIVRYMGGLGNQMFQYAFSLGANTRGIDTQANLVLYEKPDARPFMLERFPEIKKKIVYYKDNRYKRKAKKLIGLDVNETLEEGRTYQERFFAKKEATVCGYFHSPHYFENCLEAVHRDFAFDEACDSGLLFGISQMEEANSVSVHVRRGDYLQAADVYGGICTEEYYRKAMAKMEERVENPRFVFFSDDIEWVKENLHRDGAVYIDESTYDHPESWMDMCLMSHCRHNIIANSSYSWWGAFLNTHPDKIVIMPKRWDSYGEAKDLICDGWMALE